MVGQVDSPVSGTIIGSSASIGTAPEDHGVERVGVGEAAAVGNGLGVAGGGEVRVLRHHGHHQRRKLLEVHRALASPRVRWNRFLAAKRSWWWAGKAISVEGRGKRARVEGEKGVPVGLIPPETRQPSPSEREHSFTSKFSPTCSDASKRRKRRSSSTSDTCEVGREREGRMDLKACNRQGVGERQ